MHPLELPRQQVLDFTLQVEPEPSALVERRDYFGNCTDFLSVETPHRKLVVVGRSRVRVVAPKLPEPASTPAWEQVREACGRDVLTPETEAAEFRFDSPYIRRHPDFADYAAACFPAGRPVLEAVHDFTGRIFRDFTFDARATTIATPVHEVLQKRRGVCQDFAHLGIACLRSLGLPARYISGYLETLPPPGRKRLVGADASHAWFAFWCPGHGWIGADPTNNMLPGDRHIVVARGRDFSDVSPLRGVVLGGGRHRLKVGVDVVRME